MTVEEQRPQTYRASLFHRLCQQSQHGYALGLDASPTWQELTL